MIEMLQLCYRCPLIHNVQCEATQRNNAGWMCVQCTMEANIAEMEHILHHEERASNVQQISSLRKSIVTATARLNAMPARVPLHIL